MTSINDGAPLGQSPSLAASSSSARLPRTRDNTELQSPVSSISSLPYRPNAAASVLFAATTPPGSRPLSPSAGITTPKIPSGSIFGGGTPHEGAPHDRLASDGDDPRSLIAHAFVPHIAIFPSKDTDDLIGEKGFSRGLWQLLRPFGDHVQGKVIIRDSIGASRVCEDFSVRFIQLGSGYERPAHSENLKSSTAQISKQNEQHLTEDQFTATGGNIEAVENVVDLHLEYAEHFPGVGYQEHLAGRSLPASESELSPFYSLYLRRLLSGMPLAPHETFSHPVACIIAISSRNPNPIDELRRLYEEATRGEKRLPPWVNGEYLRYYVLVHDEERDDIGKAMSLFDQMKRHFGLHCHLLRLRSSRCVATDDDSIPLPTCEWMSATEELLDIQTREDQDGLDIAPPCIFESDATAITTFIREMVTQSVVPSMERCISTWNDQVASRRRGISGRFMSLSKKWTVFGNGSKASSGGPGAGGSGNNYDSLHGFYQPDTPESIMRKLADYAFMLRDWKLAQSVYELLRSDFNNDKAWRYYAAASEMAAVSTLLASHAMSSKVRIESVDQMLEASCYSYLTRCNSPYGALRCLTLSVELLKIRGESASEAAAKWGTKIIESNILGATGDALMKERVATCYRSRKGTGSGGWGSRSRKSALWDILAADKWLILGKYVQARKVLGRVRNVYDISPSKKGISGFIAANEFLIGLEQVLKRASLSGEDQNAQEVSEDIETETFEGSETLHTRTHRNSLIGATIPAMGSLETAPLHMVQEDVGGKGVKEDNFS
ncbi:hypothetical protein V502_08612 [Pseudogymnoascus sp. VKM F-4520 (FW-2644)]|nr:hypothetical protein V502_08612 [Pseudogymnoascus sp. VKM F-4520 (FW-2644)]